MNGKAKICPDCKRYEAPTSGDAMSPFCWKKSTGDATDCLQSQVRNLSAMVGELMQKPQEPATYTQINYDWQRIIDDKMHCEFSDDGEVWSKEISPLNGVDIHYEFPFRRINISWKYCRPILPKPIVGQIAKHYGGECPVTDDRVVLVRLRGRDKWFMYIADQLNWTHENTTGDVIEFILLPDGVRI